MIPGHQVPDRFGTYTGVGVSRRERMHWKHVRFAPAEGRTPGQSRPSTPKGAQVSDMERDDEHGPADGGAAGGMEGEHDGGADSGADE